MIVRIPIPGDVYAAAKAWCRDHNMGHSKFTNGNHHQQFAGVLGESAVQFYLTGQWPRMEDRGRGFDGGVDLTAAGMKADVKTAQRSGYAKPHYKCNIYAHQIHYDADALIFCSYNRFYKTIEICGWLPKKDMGTVGRLIPKGESELRDDGTTLEYQWDTYSVEASKLNDIQQIKQLSHEHIGKES